MFVFDHVEINDPNISLISYARPRWTYIKKEPIDHKRPAYEINSIHFVVVVVIFVLNFVTRKPLVPQLGCFILIVLVEN